MTSLEAVSRARHEFLEAARYIVASPEHTKAHLHAGVACIEALLVCSHAGEPIPRGPLIRIGENIQVGLNAMIVDPDVLKGYIVGARHELACIEAALKLDEDMEAMDKHLREAYGDAPVGSVTRQGSFWHVYVGSGCYHVYVKEEAARKRAASIYEETPPTPVKG